jgi:hypothetical protein
VRPIGDSKWEAQLAWVAVLEQAALVGAGIVLVEAAVV